MTALRLTYVIALKNQFASLRGGLRLTALLLGLANPAIDPMKNCSQKLVLLLSPVLTLALWGCDAGKVEEKTGSDLAQVFKQVTAPAPMVEAVAVVDITPSVVKGSARKDVDKDARSGKHLTDALCAVSAGLLEQDKLQIALMGSNIIPISGEKPLNFADAERKIGPHIEQEGGKSMSESDLGSALQWVAQKVKGRKGRQVVIFLTDGESTTDFHVQDVKALAEDRNVSLIIFAGIARGKEKQVRKRWSEGGTSAAKLRFLDETDPDLSKSLVNEINQARRATQ